MGIVAEAIGKGVNQPLLARLAQVPFAADHTPFLKISIPGFIFPFHMKEQVVLRARSASSERPVLADYLLQMEVKGFSHCEHLANRKKVSKKEKV